MRKIAVSILVLLAVSCSGGSDPSPTPTVDVDATVQAAVAATEAARPTPTLAPTPTSDVNAAAIADYLARMDSVISDLDTSEAEFDAAVTGFADTVDFNNLDSFVDSVQDILPAVDAALNELGLVMSDFLRVQDVPPEASEFHNLYLQFLQNRLFQLEGLRAAIETARADFSNAFLAARSLEGVTSDLEDLNKDIDAGLHILRDLATE